MMRTMTTNGFSSFSFSCASSCSISSVIPLTTPGPPVRKREAPGRVLAGAGRHALEGQPPGQALHAWALEKIDPDGYGTLPHPPPPP
jgi:hypothetical protein